MSTHDHLPDQPDLNLRAAFIPAGAPNRPGRLIVPRYVTVHETANTGAGANAEMHRRYVSGPDHGGHQLTSYTFVVDDREVIQLLPTNESSNHAGTVAGNASGIAIELCVNRDGDWAATRARAEALIVHLYQTVTALLPVEQGLVNHGIWGTGTACPARLRSGSGADWQSLKSNVILALSGAGINPFWDQIGEGLKAAIRQRGDEPTGPERFVHDPDRPGQNITSHVDGKQRAYTYHHDSGRVSVRSYEPLTPPG